MTYQESRLYKVEKYSKRDGWNIVKENLSHIDAVILEQTIRKPGVLTAIKPAK